MALKNSSSNSNNKNSGISRSTSLSSLPSLIVFDLDNTLWEPELYQLRNLQRQNIQPIAGKDVKLFPAIESILQSIHEGKQDEWSNTKFAVASRTKSVAWAHDLLEQFSTLQNFFHYVEIYPGDKQTHFRKLSQDSGVPFSEMLFFDDNRDGRFGNCIPVSELGVLSVHCPRGIHTEDIFYNGLEKFKEWKSADVGSHAIVEWDGSMTYLKKNQAENDEKRVRGKVKMVNAEKRFGFIRYGDRNTRDMFFHFSACDGTSLQVGDEVSFVVRYDTKKGKSYADQLEKVGNNYEDDEDNEDVVKNMRVFSMNLPFAALLANEYKTLETRNGTMFVPYPEGTKMLLHVGQRIYPDGNRHMDIMRSDGNLTDEEIEALKCLPAGFGKGMAVAIVEIGKTYETTLEQRCDPEFQRRVGAFGEDSGKMVTEIKRVEYLKRGVRVSGRGGVFKADIPRDVFPHGWL